MLAYVLDTNLFFNMEPGLAVGKTTEDVLIKVTQGMKRLKVEKNALFFMPPRIVEEFLGFFEQPRPSYVDDFLKEVTIKSPDINHITFSAAVFYQLVEDIRKRSLRGLQIAQEEVEKGAQATIGIKALGKSELEMRLATPIRSLRDRYRQATRTGFLDSVADLDLITLAKEKDAMLVSTDEGVLNWGRTFGVKEMHAQIFGKMIA
jgi:RNA ligase partner protein